MKPKLSILFIGALVVAGQAAGQSDAEAACKPVAQITAFEGQVSVKPAGKVVKKSPGKLPAPLCAGDEVHTFQGKALIVAKQDKITVDADSVLTLNPNEQVTVGKGQVLFDIQKRQTGRGIQIATRLSVIGVKGTRFLVSDKPEGVAVALDEGVVDVKSTQGKLGLYREEEVKVKVTPPLTFEQYKQQAADGVEAEKKKFEEYKIETQKLFVAYVESITMQAGTELVIAGGEAVERKTSGRMKSEMEELRKWQTQR